MCMHQVDENDSQLVPPPAVYMFVFEQKKFKKNTLNIGYRIKLHKIATTYHHYTFSVGACHSRSSQPAISYTDA